MWTALSRRIHTPTIRLHSKEHHRKRSMKFSRSEWMRMEILSTRHLEALLFSAVKKYIHTKCAIEKTGALLDVRKGYFFDDPEGEQLSALAKEVGKATEELSIRPRIDCVTEELRDYGMTLSRLETAFKGLYAELQDSKSRIKALEPR